MDTSDFNFKFLGQSVLRYQVPLDVYNTINHIYETKYPELKHANKQLVGKIEKEHSLFYNGEDNDKMTKHNHIPQDILKWFNKISVMSLSLIFSRTLSKNPFIIIFIASFSFIPLAFK